MVFGQRLREAREWYGLTVREVAALIDAPPATYHSWERGGEGEPGIETKLSEAPKRLETVGRIAWVFGVSVDWLLDVPCAERWGPAVKVLQRAIAARVEEATALTETKRVRWLVALIQDAVPDTVFGMHPRAVFGCKQRVFDQIAQGRLSVSAITGAAGRIAVLCGVPHTWLETGIYHSPSNCGEWAAIIARFESRRLSAADLWADIDMATDVLLRMVQGKNNKGGSH